MPEQHLESRSRRQAAHMAAVAGIQASFLLLYLQYCLSFFSKPVPSAPPTYRHRCEGRVIARHAASRHLSFQDTTPFARRPHQARGIFLRQIPFYSIPGTHPVRHLAPSREPSSQAPVAVTPLVAQLLELPTLLSRSHPCISTESNRFSADP